MAGEGNKGIGARWARKRKRPVSTSEHVALESPAFLLEFALVRHLASRDLERSRAAMVAEMTTCDHRESCVIHGDPNAMRGIAVELAKISGALMEALDEAQGKVTS